jgi:Mg2+ and Co2+ transporter CorA
MLTNRSVDHQTWIDLNSPTKEEADSLVLTRNIDQDVAKDLIAPTPNQNVRDRGRFVYVVLHLPTFKKLTAFCDTLEIDCIISPDTLITARYDSIDALHYFAKQIEVDDILKKNEESHLFFGMMRSVYSVMIDELSYMDDKIKEIEKNIFAGQEKMMVFALSEASRNILNFKRTVEPHGNIFELLKEIGTEKFGQKFGAQMKILVDEWRHIMRVAESQKDQIVQLRETNNSMLSTKQNEIMKQLAIIGSVLLPLTLVGQIFGLSIKFFPFKDAPYAFWLIMAIMAGVMLISIIVAKIKKWM